MVCAVVAFCASAFLLFVVGEGCAVSREQAKAVKARVGYWTIDAGTGKTEFVYGVKP